MKRALLWQSSSRIFLCLAFTLFALALFALMPSPASAAPSARDLVRSMVAAERTIAYSGTQVISRAGNAPVSTRLWRDGAKRRLEYTAPPVVNGDVLVNNGTDVWLYHHADKSAVQTRATPGRNSADLLNEAANAKLVGSEQVAGRPAWVVTVNTSSAHPALLKLWIDRATNARLRMERFDANGKRLVTVALQAVHFGPVPATKFTWQPPAGVQVTRTKGTLYRNEESARRAANWPHWPTYLPTGYRFESAVVDYKDIWLRYSNGLNRFSIFQQSDGTENKALQQVDTSWYWQTGGIRYLIVGLDRNEVVKVAGGLK